MSIGTGISVRPVRLVHKRGLPSLGMTAITGTKAAGMPTTTGTFH